MNVILIGGPADGRRVVVPDGTMQHIIAVCNEPLRVVDYRAEKHTYNLFRLHPVTRAMIFAHESLTPTQIMEALMDGYRSEVTERK